MAIPPSADVRTSAGPSSRSARRRSRSCLLDFLVSIAGFSEPIDGRNEAMVGWFGSDSDHPERVQCRAVFAENASLVARLAEELTRPGARAKLRQAAGLV